MFGRQKEIISLNCFAIALNFPRNSHIHCDITGAHFSSREIVPINSDSDGVDGSISSTTYPLVGFFCCVGKLTIAQIVSIVGVLCVVSQKFHTNGRTQLEHVWQRIHRWRMVYSQWETATSSRREEKNVTNGKWNQTPQLAIDEVCWLYLPPIGQCIFCYCGSFFLA